MAFGSTRDGCCRTARRVLVTASLASPTGIKAGFGLVSVRVEATSIFAVQLHSSVLQMGFRDFRFRIWAAVQVQLCRLSLSVSTIDAFGGTARFKN